MGGRSGLEDERQEEKVRNVVLDVGGGLERGRDGGRWDKEF